VSNKHWEAAFDNAAELHSLREQLATVTAERDELGGDALLLRRVRAARAEVLSYWAKTKNLDVSSPEYWALSDKKMRDIEALIAAEVAAGLREADVDDAGREGT